MASFTLSEAVQWLKDKQSQEHYVIFEETYKFQSWEDDKELKLYLEHIKSDPFEWFKSTPLNLIEKKSVMKTKTALNMLLKRCERVREVMGDEECEAIVKKVSNSFNNHADEIVKHKKSLKTAIDPPEEIVSDEEGALINEIVSEETGDYEKRYKRLQEISTENNRIIRRLQKINNSLTTYVKSQMDEDTWKLVQEMMEL